LQKLPSENLPFIRLCGWERVEGCTGFWWGNMRERGQWGDPNIDGDNIKIVLQEVGWACGDWIELVQDRYS